MREVNLNKPGPVAYALSGVAIWMFGQQLWAEYIQSKRARQEMRLSMLHHRRDMEVAKFRGRDVWSDDEPVNREEFDGELSGSDPWARISELEEALREANEHLAAHHGESEIGRSFLIRAENPQDAAKQFGDLIRGLTEDARGTTPPRPTPEEIKERVKKAGSTFPGAHSDEEMMQRPAGSSVYDPPTDLSDYPDGG